MGGNPGISVCNCALHNGIQYFSIHALYHMLRTATIHHDHRRSNHRVNAVTYIISISTVPCNPITTSA